MKLKPKKEQKIEGESIETVTIIPKNRYHCRFIINDGNVHVQRYDDLTKFLIQLCPALSFKIAEQMIKFRSFILFTKQNRIHPLEFDVDTEKELLKEKLKHSPSSIMTIEEYAEKVNKTNEAKKERILVRSRATNTIGSILDTPNLKRLDRKLSLFFKINGEKRV